MKIALFAHCAIDEISIGGSQFERIGGSACYGAYTIKNLGLKVDLHTRFGKDFLHLEYLGEKKINYDHVPSSFPTTRFAIDIEGVERKLRLQNFCEEIIVGDFNSDGSFVSPIYHEISFETLSKIKKNSSFVFLDPQGFLRRVNKDNNVFLEKTEIDLSGISAIKLNPEEAEKIVGGSDMEHLKLIQKKGVEYILSTNKVNVSMLNKDRLYSITLPNKEVYDTTGIGDIFSAAFCSTMIKEKDFLWALCFAGGAAQAALDTKEVGLKKVPQKGAIQTNASYFYNTLKFKNV